MKAVIEFIHKRKYEILLLALVQHLFISIVLRDMQVYEEIIWPVNMMILGVASIGTLNSKFTSTSNNN